MKLFFVYWNSLLCKLLVEPIFSRFHTPFIAKRLPLIGLFVLVGLDAPDDIPDEDSA